jgi:gluconate 5-dehydrogenase
VTIPGTEAAPLAALAGTKLLVGQNALVIGGSGGIGGTVAHTLAALGASVGLAARNVERCAALADELEREHGAETAAIAADASSRDGVLEAVDSFRRTIGKIDVLVFNAGGFAAGEVWEIPPERWRKVFAINVDAPFFAVQAAFDDLVERPGNVIFVSSVGGMLSFRRGVSKVVPYTTSKAALIHLTRDLAVQLGDFGIRVNSLAPGQIDSGFTDSLSDDQKAAMAEQIPLGRLGRPDDLAGAVAFLASDLSRYVTGHVLTVDGGLTAQ